MNKIKVAIVGVGNCASSFVQGLEYYRDDGVVAGLINPVLGGYRPSDIEVVAAFDVAEGKVGNLLSDAIFNPPNCTVPLVETIRESNVIVQRGPTLDGLGKYLEGVVFESEVPSVSVADVLRDSGAQVLINYLPVGSVAATAHYMWSALDAGCAVVNCIPEFVASDPDWGNRFKRAGVPIIGDDIKSQVGATIVHRALAQLLRDRGVQLLQTLQLNIGGNTDFLNMLERERLVSKKLSKTEAVTSVMGTELPARDVHVGPSDHVAFLNDRKWAYIYLWGAGFAGAEMKIELKLEVHDSPNSAGVVMDAVRCAAIARDRGIAGPVEIPSAWYMKHPPKQVDDDMAQEMMRQWVDWPGVL